MDSSWMQIFARLEKRDIYISAWCGTRRKVGWRGSYWPWRSGAICYSFHPEENGSRHSYIHGDMNEWRMPLQHINVSLTCGACVDTQTMRKRSARPTYFHNQVLYINTF
jgi:hypothetical protein